MICNLQINLIYFLIFSQNKNKSKICFLIWTFNKIKIRKLICFRCYQIQIIIRCNKNKKLLMISYKLNLKLHNKILKLKLMHFNSSINSQINKILTGWLIHKYKTHNHHLVLFLKTKIVIINLIIHKLITKVKFKTIYFKIVCSNRIQFNKINLQIYLGLLMSKKMQASQLSLRQIKIR